MSLIRFNDATTTNVPSTPTHHSHNSSNFSTPSPSHVSDSNTFKKIEFESSRKAEKYAKMHFLEKKANGLKDRLVKCSFERDNLEGLYLAEKQKNADLQFNLQSLNDKLTSLREKNSRIPILEKQIFDHQSCEEHLQNELQQCQVTIQNSINTRDTMLFERNAAIHRAELKEDSYEKLRVDINELQKNYHETFETLNQTRQELLDSHKALAFEKSENQQNIAKLEETINYRSEVWRSQLNAKQFELDNFIQVSNQIPSNNLESELNKAKISSLESELEILRDKLHNTELKFAQLSNNSIAVQQAQANCEIERIRLVNELHQREQENENSKRENEVQIRENQSLRADLDSLRCNMRAIVDRKDKQLNEMKNSLSLSEERSTMLNSEVADNKDQYASLESKFDQFKRLHRFCSGNSKPSSSKDTIAMNTSRINFSCLTNANNINAESSVDEQKRIDELMQRNEKAPRHLQSHYLPETMRMKGNVRPVYKN